MPINIVKPSDGGKKIIGMQYRIECSQQVQGPVINGTVGAQFSNDSNGPWATAQPGDGDFRCDLSGWSAQDTTVELSAASFGDAYIRVAVWDGNNNPYIDEPDIVSDNVIFVKVSKPRNAEA